MLKGPRGFQAFAEPIILLDAVFGALGVTGVPPTVLLLLQGDSHVVRVELGS
jgi:hypothetical protein